MMIQFRAKALVEEVPIKVAIYGDKLTVSLREET